MIEWKHMVGHVVIGWLLSVLAIPLPHATAQVSLLDKGTLIDTLTQYGMDELLGRLEQTDPGQDPVVVKLVQIGRLRLRYRNASLARDKQVAAFDQMVDAMRRLIQSHPEHEQRSIWQTDLASALLFDGLQGLQQYAAEFYEFGVPTDRQRKAFESSVAEAFEQLVDAQTRFFHLAAELPRQPDHAAKRVDTGLWDRLIKEYYNAKTPFLLAHAAYHTSLLSDDHPYFKNLNNPKIPRQKNTAPEERARLLNLALEQLAPLAANPDDLYQIRLQALCLKGRSLMRQPNRVEEAIGVLDTVSNTNSQDFTHLLARLAQAMVLDKQDKTAEAWQTLVNLSGHRLVQQDLLLRLLVVDLQHRLKLARAMKQPPNNRPAETAKAYEPYEQLLSDPALGQDAAGIKNYIYARWESMVNRQEQDLASIPDTVLAAAGEMARIAGQALVYQADQLEQQGGQDQPVADLLAQAKPKLKRAVSINADLLKRETLAPRVRANAGFNQAMARYLLAQGDVNQLVDAATQWTDLAQQMPDQPIAEQAMTSAITVLHALHVQKPTPPAVARAYERAAGVLFDRFPTIPAADQECVYYTYYILSPRGNHAEAAGLLKRIPKTHMRYYEAQREMITSLKKVFDNTQDVAGKDPAGKKVVENAKRLIQEAAGEPNDTDPQRFQDARVAHGVARLVLVDMAIAQNQMDQARAQLEGFDDDFKDQPDLVRQALSKDIVVLAQAGDFGPLVNRAKTMMKLFPDDAAAVIDGVLTDLTRQIDRLRIDANIGKLEREKQAMLNQAKSLSQAAQMLAELLLDWAVRQDMLKADLVPFELLLAKATRLAGKADQAVEMLKPLLAQNPDDTELIFNMAEALFAIGDEPSLIQAAEYYDKLIVGMGPPYPTTWWNAWLSRLKIMDKLNTSVADIPLRIRALELTDPNLGGEPYRSQFKRLQLKHAQ